MDETDDGGAGALLSHSLLERISRSLTRTGEVVKRELTCCRPDRTERERVRWRWREEEAVVEQEVEEKKKEEEEDERRRKRKGIRVVNGGE